MVDGTWRHDAAAPCEADGTGNVNNVVALSADVPEGCSVAVASEAVTLHLQLRGLVDPVQEGRKLAARAAKLEDEAGKLRKRMSAPGYDKVPAEVRRANAEQLAAVDKQVADVAELARQNDLWQQQQQQPQQKQQ